MGQQDNAAEELPIEETPEPSLRDALEESIESIQSDESKEKSVSMDGLLPDEVAPAIPEEKGEKQPEGERPDGDGQKPEEQQLGQEGDKKDLEEEPEKKTNKAPVGWNPKAREAWSKVPPEAQEMIVEREKQVEDVLRETSFARETHSFIDNIAKSYAPIMAAEGVDNPLAAVQGLFQTVAELRMGSPAQKAQRMAAMIDHYGIDIQALDNALVGNPAQPSEETALTAMINEKMAPVNQLLSELQNRQTQNQRQVQQEAEREVSQFQGEFLSDVRNDMADLIDMAATRGQNMSLQEAYDKAILLRPEIQEVLTKRAQDEALLGNQRNLQGKRNASSSVSGRQIGDGSGGGGAMSMRDSIANAWEQTEEKI